ncbi:MAG: hypothetical protein AAGM22_14705 [Acidobacteriota bacterium]
MRFRRNNADGGGWVAVPEHGPEVPWRGLQTGPLTLSDAEIAALCRSLVGCPPSEIGARADRILVPAVGDRARLPAILLHSTTPDLKTFDGDLDALLTGGPGGDFTTYKEARSVYLGGPGDIAVGRTDAWQTAVDALGARAIRLEDCDHYYLSHALLHLASKHAESPVPSMTAWIEALRERPRVIRLYAFELEMQIFLLWLARQAGLHELAVEANRASISTDWNRKDVLHPTVDAAATVPATLRFGGDPFALLAAEGQRCELAERMDLEVPRVPGYTVQRRGRSVDAFVRQTLDAARWLRERHGLELGCFKASESGDGARITPGLDLNDGASLGALARRSFVHGDDYVLEAHVHYGRATIAGQTLPTALSAHIRGGAVADGATIQFMEGPSWKGNILLDGDSAPLFNVPVATYRRLHGFMRDFHAAFEAKAPGLVLAGLDFAIGTVGGRYGDKPLLGVQDLNISFTGAECLRAFLDKVRGHSGDSAQGYGVTRIFRPRPTADHHDFLRVTRRFIQGHVFADTVAAIPGRWGMVGITGEDPEDAVRQLNRLHGALLDADLLLTTTRP